MPRLDARPAENKPLAIALILITTLIFALSDAVAKLMVARISPIEVSWIRSVVVMVITLPIVYARIGRQVFAPQHPMRQILRGAAVLGSSLLYLTGLTYLPLADASAINFIWPVLITVLSVIFLGEKVGLRRWGATVLGFIGMLIIIRPGSSAFQTAAIYPIGAAVMWAFASLMTRGMTSTDPPETTIFWSALVMLVGTTITLPYFWTTPGWYEIGLGVFVGVGSAVAHALIVFAFERASAATLAPFAYLQLVWATMLGYLMFSTIPDRWILTGSVLIVISGIYTAHRERVRAKLDKLEQ